MALLAPFPNTLPQELRDEIFSHAATACDEGTFMMVDVHSRQRAGYPNRYHTLTFSHKETLANFLQLLSIPQTENLKPKGQTAGLFVRRMWLQSQRPDEIAHYDVNDIYNLLDVCGNVRDICLSWTDFRKLFWPSSGKYPTALAGEKQEKQLHLMVQGSCSNYWVGDKQIPEDTPDSAIPVLNRVTRFITSTVVPEHLLTSIHPLFQNVTHLALPLPPGNPGYDEKLPPLPALRILVYFDYNERHCGRFGFMMVLKHLLQDRRVCVLPATGHTQVEDWKNRPDDTWERAPEATVAAGRNLLSELRFDGFNSSQKAKEQKYDPWGLVDLIINGGTFFEVPVSDSDMTTPASMIRRIHLHPDVSAANLQGLLHRLPNLDSISVGLSGFDALFKGENEMHGVSKTCRINIIEEMAAPRVGLDGAMDLQQWPTFISPATSTMTHLCFLSLPSEVNWSAFPALTHVAFQTSTGSVVSEMRADIIKLLNHAVNLEALVFLLPPSEEKSGGIDRLRRWVKKEISKQFRPLLHYHLVLADVDCWHDPVCFNQWPEALEEVRPCEKPADAWGYAWQLYAKNRDILGMKTFGRVSFQTES